MTAVAHPADAASPATPAVLTLEYIGVLERSSAGDGDVADLGVATNCEDSAVNSARPVPRVSVRSATARSSRSFSTGDKPRICGEHGQNPREKTPYAWGPAPLARGAS